MFQIRIRVVVGLMIFLGYFFLYVVRYNLSVHIVDMAGITKREKNSHVYNFTYAREAMKNVIDTMNWDDMKVARLFAAYHIGYCICFPIFHNVGDKIGPTWVIGIAGLTSGVLNCLTPASSIHDFWALFTIQIMKGFCAGAMQPSMVQVLRNWVPPIERNLFIWAYCGITTGTFSTFLICAAVHYYSRWPVGFYVTGVIQVLWAALWVLVASDSPSRHPFISTEEMTYLANTIGTNFTIKLTNAEAPWAMILKSVPFWALCILNFGYAWMIISLCLHGPLYYALVINYTIYSASVLTALPFFLRLVLGTIVIHLYHRYSHLNDNAHKVKNLRKYFIVVSHVLSGAIVMISWVLPIFPGPILLTMAVALTAVGMDMALEICYEMTPIYVNSVNTVIKIIGNTAGIILSFCTGQVTQSFGNSPYIWKHIWCFHATLLLASGIIFLIWGDINVQPWNAVKYRRRRPMHAVVRPSLMSNIMEVDEDTSSVRLSTSSTPSKMKTLILSKMTRNQT